MSWGTGKASRMERDVIVEGIDVGKIRSVPTICFAARFVATTSRNLTFVYVAAAVAIATAISGPQATGVIITRELECIVCVHCWVVGEVWRLRMSLADAAASNCNSKKK
jgi:hypothetical protein